MTKAATRTAAKNPTTGIKAAVYTRVTERILADLAQGVRPWIKPWSAANTEGKIARALRFNGTPNRGMNVLLLWGEAMDRGYQAPIWMTYKQAQELGGQVRKGETGSLVVYADRFTKTETGDKGQEIEREIPFMKGYTVFNVGQIDGLPAQYQQAPCPAPEPLQLIAQAEAFFKATGARFQHGGNHAFYAPARDFIQLPPAEAFKDPEATPPPRPTSSSTGPATRAATRGNLESALVMMPTLLRSLSPSWAPRFSVLILASRRRSATTTPPILATGCKS